MTIAIVTGSSTGIGYATALRLARDGHRVVGTMRDPDSSDLASAAKQQALDVEVLPLDVTDGTAISELFADVITRHGTVDVLVNNAGVGDGAVVEGTDLDTYRRVMETNFFGALACIKAVLPSMRERGSGSIVNVSSQAGQIAFPNMSAYCSSKWALEALSESLAVEVAPLGIRVAIVEPGLILTPIWSKMDMTPPAESYANVVTRLATTVIEEMAFGTTSEAVADTIAEAISTDSPQLRWLTGHGAVRNVVNRRSKTDQEWIDLWHGPEDAWKAYVTSEPS
jgi:NAD(P)-dependent dehydrogenase (short-subunit alcohol dehydrogenase family)